MESGKQMSTEDVVRFLEDFRKAHDDHGIIFPVARDITSRKQTEAENEKPLTELMAALAEVKALKEIIPICSYCRRVCDDENYWQTVETYISSETKSQFSHDVCPSCFAEHLEPEIRERRCRSKRSGAEQ